MGLMDNFFALENSPGNLALAAGLLRGSFADGVAGYAQANSPEARMKRDLLRLELEDGKSKIADRQFKTKQAQLAAEQDAELRAAIPGLFGGQQISPGAFQTPAVDGVGPILPESARPAPGAGGFDVQKALALRMDPKMIQEYAALANIGRPKVARTIEIMRNGRPVTIQVDESGQEVGQGFDQWKAPVMQQLGNRVAALDPVSLGERGSFAMGQSPDSKASNALGWANHALSGQRLALERDGAAAGKVPSGYRAKGDGTLEFIPGGPADPNAARRAAPTEDERKAAGWLAQATNGFNNMEKATAMNPKAANPTMLETIKSLPEGVKNMTRSDERQMFNQGASSLSEAVLRAATGAGVNADEARQKVAELTPQWGDSKAVIAQKREGAQMYLESLAVRAGRAGTPQGQPQAAQPATPKVSYRYVNGKLQKVD